MPFVADGYDLDSINIKDYPYLAKGDGTTNDQAAIQAAIDYLAGRRGGRIVFPPGEYRIVRADATVAALVLPRANQLAIELVGNGVTATTLYVSQAADLPTNIPLIGWESENAPAWRFRLANMTVGRTNGGKVLRHDTPFGGAVGGDRFWNCSIEHVDFTSGGTTETLVELLGILRCKLDHVGLRGGATSLLLSGSHLTCVNVHSSEDFAQSRQIDISAGGN